MKKVILLLITSLLSIPALAQTFSITPQGTLPTIVPKAGSVSALYTVKNLTNTTLNNSHVKSLPLNVTQVTCQPQYCGPTFNLGAAGSASVWELNEVNTGSILLPYFKI